MLTDTRRDGFACDTECPFVGTTAAILIGAGIAAAGGVASAKIQSNAANKAVKAQQEATTQAIGNLKPYQDTGTQAFTTLGALMGLGGPGGGQAPQAAQAFDPGYTAAQANFDHYSPTGGYVGKDTPMSQQMNNPAVNVDGQGYTAANHGAPTSSSYQPAQGNPTTGGMYQVRVPGQDNRVVLVPAEKVAEATQNGGTVVGRA